MGTVTVEVEDRVAVVKFHSSHKGFMDGAMALELSAVMDRLEVDPAVRVIIFTGGQADAFIRHFSVEDLIELGGSVKAGRQAGMPPPRMARGALRAPWEKIDNSQKPTIAAINGYCGGGGCELALCCDIRLAGPGSYTIGQMEIQVGLIPGAGATTRLSRAVGAGKALEWLLRGRVFYPEEAAREGLVHHYTEGDVLEAARTMAREFLDRPPLALAYIKQIVRSSLDIPIAESLDQEDAGFMELLSNDDLCRKTMSDYVAGGHKISKV